MAAKESLRKPSQVLFTKLAMVVAVQAATVVDATVKSDTDRVK